MIRRSPPYEHTLDLNPNFPHAHAALGRALIEVGRAKDSIPYIEHALRLSPTDPAAWIWCYWAGMAAVHAADYDVAIHWLLKSRETNRASDNTAFWLALTYTGRGRTNEAKSFMAEFLASRPRWTMARWSLRPPYQNPIVAQQRLGIAGMMRELGIRAGDSQTEGQPSRQL
jgi:tetratricopeptide (TPR) repeat protein